MPIALIYGVTVAFGLLAWSVFAAQYLWPTMSKRERTDALRPILVLHSFRYIGLVALIPGVVSPELASTDSLVGWPTVIWRPRSWPSLLSPLLGRGCLELLVWIFNSFGTADLLNAFYQGGRISLADNPGMLGAGYFLPIFGVPLLLVTHILVFRLLMRKETALSSLLKFAVQPKSGHVWQLPPDPKGAC